MFDDLIDIINKYIISLETKDIVKEYEFSKELIKHNKINYNFDEENDIFSIIFSFILVNKKYKSIDEIIRVYNKYKNIFNKLDIEEYSLFYLYMICKELESDSLDMLIKNEKDYTELFEVFNDSMKLVQEEVMPMIYHLMILDDNKKYFNENVYSDMVNHDIKKKSEQKSAKAFLEKHLKDNIINGLNLNEYQKILDNNIRYMNSLRNDIKIINKNIFKSKSLIELIKSLSNQKEITSIDYILKNTPNELKFEVLKYIGIYNLEYYKLLEDEYNSKLEHSLGMHMSLLYKYNINYNELTDEVKQEIINLTLSELKNKLDILKDLLSVENALAVAYSNIDIINYFSECVSYGIISKEYISNNIEILYDPLKNNKSKFDLFKNNKEIISKKLNIKNLDKESYNIFLCDTYIIMSNLEVIEKEDIKINRSLKNYMFLSSYDLELKIKELKENDIDIDKHLYLLNSDYNILKRIKICNLLNIDIYNLDGKIKDEVLHSDKFMMTNEQIDEYLNEKEMYKVLLNKLYR